MKKLLAASLIAMTAATTGARAETLSVYDAYMGFDLGLAMMSYVDLSSDELKYTPNSSILMGFDLGAKFRPLNSIWNPGVSLAMNLTFPVEPEKWTYKQKPTYSWYTWGADFDNYFAISSREDASSRTDLILGIGYHAVTTSWVGGGYGDDSSTDMSLALKFGIDQSISENLKLNAKMQFFLLPGSSKGEQDVFTKISIGFKAVY